VDDWHPVQIAQSVRHCLLYNLSLSPFRTDHSLQRYGQSKLGVCLVGLKLNLLFVLMQ
jgi:hypothetical protein